MSLSQSKASSKHPMVLGQEETERGMRKRATQGDTWTLDVLRTRESETKRYSSNRNLKLKGRGTSSKQQPMVGSMSMTSDKSKDAWPWHTVYSIFGSSRLPKYRTLERGERRLLCRLQTVHLLLIARDDGVWKRRTASS
mmetsp:Transcript_87200/g.182488  ORF Transcript_87200/g.182488 Transcript_87200/m.182488 type:complete len:139 (+) Transcript_87200:134-550(+)